MNSKDREKEEKVKAVLAVLCALCVAGAVSVALFWGV